MGNAKRKSGQVGNQGGLENVPILTSPFCKRRLAIFENEKFMFFLVGRVHMHIVTHVSHLFHGRGGGTPNKKKQKAEI